MEKLTSIKALLSRIRLAEGAEFECDEEAVFEAYRTLEENQSSLAIKILSIFGGFIAMLAFGGFLAIAGLMNDTVNFLVLGVGFIITAIVLNKIYDKIIIDTFSVSIYILGFVLLAFGLFEMKMDETMIAIIISLFALSSLIISQNFIISFISILTISSSFLFIIIYNDVYNLVHLYIAIHTLFLTYLLLNEAKIISYNNMLSQLYDPLRIGLIIALLFGLVTVGKRFIIPISQSHIWLSSIVMILVILYLVNIMLKINEINTSESQAKIYTLSAIILLSTIFSPAISGAIVIILLSFLVNYKTGLAIGIISLIYFISQFYYDLGLTLLTKSIILMLSGILFLVCYFLTTKNLITHEEI